MNPFHFVIAKILIVYAIESSDVGVTLVLESCPVERRGFLDGEAVRFSFVKSLSKSCSVPCNFLGNTSAFRQFPNPYTEGS